MRGCVCDNWKPSLLPRLIFSWRTFTRRITAPLVTGGWAKYQVLTNQNSRNSWCQIVRGTMLQNTSGCCFWKKMDAEDEILMMGYLLMRKRSNHQQRKKWSGKYFCSITRCHSLPLVINRFSTRLSFYKRPFFHSFIKLKVYRILFFHLFSMDWRQK